MCILGPGCEHEHAVTLLSIGGLVDKALDVRLHFLQVEFLPFFNTEKCSHVPAHGAILLAAGNHLECKGSALPPARHSLWPVSIAIPGQKTHSRKLLQEVTGVCQHHQQQWRQLRGMARYLHGCCSCRTMPALSESSLT